MIEKFQMAYQTELGSVLLFLLFLFVLLSMVYFYLKVRQKKRDRLAYQFDSYYASAEKLAKAFTFSEKHLVEFFGRETIVQVKSKQKAAVCVIPPPHLSTEEIRTRFQAFQRALGESQSSIFASYEWVYTSYPFILVQGGLLHMDGRKLLPIDRCLKDGKITEVEKEKVLLELAGALARLHEKRTESGEQIYHGCLTPRSVFVDISADHQLNRIVVANLGLCYAFGPKIMQERLTAIKSGKVHLDQWMRQELVDQMSMIAPEQLDLTRLEQVGAACDFYTYAALAISLFTKKKFKGLDTVEWASIPEKWAPFLQNCLQNEPSERPKNFSELEEWLSDPELELTHYGIGILQGGSNESFANKEDVGDFNVEAIQALPFNLKDITVVTEDDLFTKKMMAGNKALKMGKWKIASQYFMEATRVNDKSCEAKIKLAICCYEVGEMEEAENYYRSVKLDDPELAKLFRKHIAFRF